MFLIGKGQKEFTRFRHPVSAAVGFSFSVGGGRNFWGHWTRLFIHGLECSSWGLGELKAALTGRAGLAGTAGKVSVRS